MAVRRHLPHCTYLLTPEGDMNPCYRKARRLKSRHYRRGHTPWCQCPEPWQSFAISLRRWVGSGRPLPRRTQPELIERASSLEDTLVERRLRLGKDPAYLTESYADYDARITKAGA